MRSSFYLQSDLPHVSHSHERKRPACQFSRPARSHRPWPIDARGRAPPQAARHLTCGFGVRLACPVRNWSRRWIAATQQGAAPDAKPLRGLVPSALRAPARVSFSVGQQDRDCLACLGGQFPRPAQSRRLFRSASAERATGSGLVPCIDSADTGLPSHCCTTQPHGSPPSHRIRRSAVSRHRPR